MNRYKCVVTDVQATAAAAAHPDGAYVKWTDHVAEVERLKARLMGIDFLFAWMTTENPMLGGVTPLWMMEHGKGAKLAEFIKDASLAPAAQDTQGAAK